jgi:hypothetical protein
LQRTEALLATHQVLEELPRRLLRDRGDRGLLGIGGDGADGGRAGPVLVDSSTVATEPLELDLDRFDK